MDKKHIGSHFETFLQEEELLAETEALALKRIFAWKIAQAIEDQGITKSEVARRMGTSRAAFDRLLDPTNTSVTLRSLERAVIALGKRMRIEIQEAAPLV